MPASYRTLGLDSLAARSREALDVVGIENLATAERRASALRALNDEQRRRLAASSRGFEWNSFYDPAIAFFERNDLLPRAPATLR